MRNQDTEERNTLSSVLGFRLPLMMKKGSEDDATHSLGEITRNSDHSQPRNGVSRENRAFN